MTVKAQHCEFCLSSDNLKLFDNGSSFCFTPDCEYNKQKKTIVDDTPKDLVQGEYKTLTNRRISQRTCEFFSYQLGQENGEPCHIANYRDKAGKIVAQKLRLEGKKFQWRGEANKASLFGRHLWSNNSPNIIITEGELDCLSIAESQDCKWPVVSIPNGAASATKTIKSELDWLLGFKNIILCFDNDEAGQKATEECVALFPPGKVKIAKLSEKDANDCLVKGKIPELTKLVWNADEYRPDGIVWGNEIDWVEIRKPKPRGLSLPYPILDEMIRGFKPGRIYTVFAGTGLGKSTCLREIGLHISKLKLDKPAVIANIFLEENYGFTAESYLAMNANIPEYKLEENPDLLSVELFEQGKSLVANMGFYNHFGSLDSKRLFNLFDYLVLAKGVTIIMLDHISLLMSGMRSESGEGERRDIDLLMTNLRSFGERTRTTIVTATQLKRKKGSYSEGEEITEADARGCVDDKTEFLTPTGWVYISEYRNQDVGVYDLNTGLLKFEPSEFLKKKADKFYHLKSARGIDQVVSPEHRMLYKHGNSNKFNFCLTDKFVERHVKSKTGNRARFITTFSRNDETKTYSEVIIRLQVAYQADGTLSKRPLCHVFKFKKERKYLRLKMLLEESGLVFKDYGLFKCGHYCIETKIPDVFKVFPESYWKMGKNELLTVLDEVKYWDSELTTGRYFSTEKMNADFIQYVYAINNIRSVISYRTKLNIKWRTLYKVSPSRNDTVSMANRSGKIDIQEYTNHDGYKYCFTTSTGAWVARRNGRIFITSNSGAIEHISDVIFSLNVDTQSSNPNDAQIKVIKNRITGQKGNADLITYNEKTGRYLPVKQSDRLPEKYKHLGKTNEEDLI